MSTNYTQDSSTVRDAVIERGKEIYEKNLRAEFEPQYIGSYLAIDPETRQYFLSDTSAGALSTAHAALPQSRFYLMRIGYETAHTIGGHVARRR